MTQEAKIIGGIGIATVVLVIGAALYLGGQSSQQPQNNERVTDTQRLVGADSYKVEVPNAKATVVEFADFQCPACRSAHPVVKQMLEDYEGKVTYVYRHFPLPAHRNASLAAQAAEAAGAQGKFFEYHDVLFEKQQEWSDTKSPIDTFTKYAADLGLDETKFKEALEKRTYAEKVQKEQDDGIALGVNSTPTFFVDGQRLVGVPTYDSLKQTIDAALKD